ncbi:hypothetical protein chiPu_0032193, partial [Chiloscyllium punctatum]|nr:hypothetical protein [Chiloscyllium punctatum]
MRSAHDVQEILHHRIGRRDHLGVGRIGLLGHDQLGELVGDIGVRALERRTDDGAGLAEQRRAGLVGRLERTAVDALEEVGAVEGRHRDFGEVDVAAVGVVADDAAVGRDADRLQLAGRETVLLDLVDLDVA